MTSHETVQGAPRGKKAEPDYAFFDATLRKGSSRKKTSLGAGTPLTISTKRLSAISKD